MYNFKSQVNQTIYLQTNQIIILERRKDRERPRKRERERKKEKGKERIKEREREREYPNLAFYKKIIQSSITFLALR